MLCQTCVCMQWSSALTPSVRSFMLSVPIGCTHANLVLCSCPQRHMPDCCTFSPSVHYSLECVYWCLKPINLTNPKAVREGFLFLSCIGFSHLYQVINGWENGWLDTKLKFVCLVEQWGLCKYIIVHSKIATQSSHSVDRAGWQSKMASIEFWIPWRDAHRAYWCMLTAFLLWPAFVFLYSGACDEAGLLPPHTAGHSLSVSGQCVTNRYRRVLHAVITQVDT